MTPTQAYRVLERLMESGEVQRIELLSAYFPAQGGRQGFLVCRCCRSAQPIAVSALWPAVRRLCRAAGFLPLAPDSGKLGPLPRMREAEKRARDWDRDERRAGLHDGGWRDGGDGAGGRGRTAAGIVLRRGAVQPGLPVKPWWSARVRVTHGMTHLLGMVPVMRYSVSLLCVLAGLSPVAAQAQCLECAQQMFQATLTTNIWYNINQDQIDQTRSSDARNGTCYDANRHFEGCRGKAPPSRSAGGTTAVSRSVASQAESVVMAVLDAEYRRRVRAYGNADASQWLNRAAGDTGRQVGALDAEYRRRLGAGGSAGADGWYIESARQIATRYIGGNAGRGEAVIGGVPAATRKRAEDASFAVIEPEIARREKADGQAKTIEWARSVGQAVGAGVRNLAPEYAQRARVDGRASADTWYVDQARNLATRQVRSAR